MGSIRGNVKRKFFPGKVGSLSRIHEVNNALVAAAGCVIVFVLWARPELTSRPAGLLSALAITAALAFFAWYARGVNLSGALAGSAVAFILAARDMRMFCMLLVVQEGASCKSLS